MEARHPSMSEKLAQEFQQDPLFKHLTKLDQMDSLFDDHMEDLKEGVDYTTTEFESWYCTSEDLPNYLGTGSTMRSWLKQLNAYIEARMSARTVFMDYHAVFRLKMALLLRKQNVKLARVAELVGIANAANVRVMDSFGSNSANTSMVDPFAGDEERRAAFAGFIEKIVEDRFNSRLMMLPSSEDMEEMIRSESDQIRSEMDEKITRLASQLTDFQKKVGTEDDAHKMEAIVKEMRDDAETRSEVIMKQTRQMLEERRIQKEEKDDLYQEFVKNLPWFVRMFVKKR